MRKLLVLSALLISAATVPAGGGSAGPGPENPPPHAASLARPGGTMERVIGEMLRQETALAAAVIGSAPVDTLRALRRTVVAAQIAMMPETQRAALRNVAAAFARLVNQHRAILRHPWVRSFIAFDPASDGLPRIG